MSERGPLELLYEVQQLDVQQDELQAEELRVPEDLAGARRERERLNNTLEDAEIELEGVEKSVRALEGDLAGTRDQLARTQAEQDKNAFDPKAQVQFQNRIQQLSDRATETEEGLLPLHERQSGLIERRAALRGQLRELRPRIGTLEDEDAGRVQALRAQGEALSQARKDFASKVDTRLLKEYEVIRKAKRGLGIVPVDGGRCTGCNMQLPVTVQQRVATGRLPAVKCPSCGRFLVKLG